MRRIILVLCLLLACGVAVAGTEEMVAEKKTAPADKAETKSEPTKSETAEDEKAAENAVQATAKVGDEADDEACRESFNTLEDIYGGDKEALAAHLAEEKKAETADAEEAPAIEWKEVPEDKPER